jgi:hypothetical protein
MSRGTCAYFTVYPFCIIIAESTVVFGEKPRDRGTPDRRTGKIMASAVGVLGSADKYLIQKKAEGALIKRKLEQTP